MVAILRDQNGAELTRILQTNTPDRYRADFVLRESIRDVYSIEFRFEDGSPAYVREGIQIGVTLA